MGTTRAALHLASTEGMPARERIMDALQALGWTLSEADGEAGPVMRVAIHQAEGEPCATVAMAGNDRIDDGTLKELAVVLSRGSGMPAVVTGIDDSDAFDLILYADGRQIDALGAAADEQDSGLKRIAPAERVVVWPGLFGRLPGPLPVDRESPFADDALDAFLSWIGVNPAIAHLSFGELAERSGRSGDTRLLSFVRAPDSGSTDRATDRGAAPILAPHHDDDDCRPHSVYPAPWPLPTDKRSGLRWLIRSSGSGFDGATVDFEIDDVSGGTIRSTKLSMQAYPFFNGQITSATPAATHEATVHGILEEGVWSHEAPSFSIPDLDPEAGKNLAIILRLECICETGATARMRPRFKPHGYDSHPLDLPPVRIIGGRMDWRPIGSDAGHLGDAYRESLLLELNTPSVLSLVAIQNGDTEEIRESVRQAVGAWLGSLSRASECSAVVLTKKHMTASGSITKKRMEFPLPELIGDPALKRWFSGKADLQTLRIDIRPQGAFRPVAGFLMQAGLREILIGGDPAPEAEQALHVVFWTVDHPDAWAVIGSEREAWIDRLEGWIEQGDVLQAYRTATAGIPAFDSYENYELTVYEQLSGVDWFRRALKGKLMAKAWCGQTVRCVSPRMWLGQSLVDRLSTRISDLEAGAVVTPLAGMLRITLREEVAAIGRLERSMSPILPSAR